MASAKPKRKRRRFSWRTFAGGIALLAAMLFAHSQFEGMFERAELIAYDLRIKRLPPSPSTGQIVIAAIDDKSISDLGQWPWPRSRFGQFVDALRDYKAAVIAFDVVFSEPDHGDVERAEITQRLHGAGLSDQAISASLGAGNDDTFAAAIKKQGATVLSYAFRSHDFRAGTKQPKIAGFLDKIRPPPPMGYGIVRQTDDAAQILYAAQSYLPPVDVLNAAAHSTGFADIDADADGTIRAAMTVVKFNDRFCAPMFMAAADALAGDAPLALAIGPTGITNVSFPGLPIPVDDLGRMLLNFRTGPDPFPYYSLSDVLNHRIPADQLAGKIVLIGATAHGLGDRAGTPINPDMPRVEIQATAIDNVIKGDFFRRTTEAEGLARLAALAIGAVTAIAVAWLSAAVSAIVSGILLVGYYLYAQQRLATDGTVIGVVFPLATGMLMYMMLAGYRYITEGRERQRQRSIMEHYLHPDVLASVLESPEGLRLGGERRHLAILFSDIVGFTSRAEKSEPEALVTLLNTYMTEMIDVILKSGGVVDKLMGDGIMAFWGAPNAIDNPSRSAINAALEMIQRLRKLQAGDPRFADLDIGIGIASGEAIVGNFGGKGHFDYSAIGDSVNLASRLEGLTRHFKVHVIVSGDAFAEAGDGFVARELGLARVKGKANIVPIVEVAGHGNDGADPAFYQRFADALKMVRGGNAPAALDELRRLGVERPKDAPVRIFVEKLAADPVHPPKDIVFEFDSK
ncbi:MAG TPA: adenylate/guanylate cyclase domain-containing protein [Candidatus Binataceae bacterium]|nr:adenylate/guanylate cyclase domain-containing protein [Candidatus Binataceae bacterium]